MIIHRRYNHPLPKSTVSLFVETTTKERNKSNQGKMKIRVVYFVKYKVRGMKKTRKGKIRRNRKGIMGCIQASQ